ncbi:MAG: hypothetical protein IKG85_05370 [Clostridia bacterium]|nr:hypothetical protein [Clostridia bacterium]
MGADKNAIGFWAAFEKSGKLEDYLLFCEKRRGLVKPEKAPLCEEGAPDQSSL